MPDLHVSEVVAGHLAHLRKAARLNREEFAERCRQLGGEALAEFTAAALTNVETGRRDAGGRRTRRVTADELVAFAAVFEIPLDALVSCDSHQPVESPFVDQATVVGISGDPVAGHGLAGAVHELTDAVRTLASAVAARGELEPGVLGPEPVRGAQDPV